MASSPVTAPYTRAVVNAMRKLYVLLLDKAKSTILIDLGIQKRWRTRVSTILGVRNDRYKF